MNMYLVSVDLSCVIRFVNMQPSTPSPIIRFGLTFGAIFCVFGSPVMAFFLTRIFLEAKASASWPTTPGIIQKVAVRETSVSRYYADVSYTYSAAGRDYTGTRISASDGEYNVRDGAVQAIHGLHVGQGVTVYYDPSNPSQSVIRAGAGFTEYVLFCVPIAFFAFGIYAFRQLLRTKTAK